MSGVLQYDKRADRKLKPIAFRQNSDPTEYVTKKTTFLVISALTRNFSIVINHSKHHTRFRKQTASFFR